MRSCPFFFKTVTIEFTHSVGSCTLVITPSVSILSSSFLSFGRMVMGTFRGGCTAGLWFGLSSIRYVASVMHPRPWKVSAYLRRVSFVSISMRCKRLSSTQVFNPRMFVTLFAIIWNSIGQYLFLCSQRRVVLPIVLILCPPKAISLALDV